MWSDGGVTQAEEAEPNIQRQAPAGTGPADLLLSADVSSDPFLNLDNV